LRKKSVVVGQMIAKGGRKPSPILGRNEVTVPKGPPREGGEGLPEHFFNLNYNGVVGCPSWFINCYSGLLTEIEGIPVVSTQTDVRIKLNRGVKQGCPLSPIIFAICFDVLLHRLRLRGRPGNFFR
jgi:hypothetical protein